MTAVLTYKVLHGSVTWVRSSDLPGRRCIRSASTDHPGRIVIQFILLACSRTLKVVATQTWNALLSPTLHIFHKRLQTHMFHQSYPDIVP